MERFTEGSGRRIVAVDNTTVDIARAIHSLSDADLVRLKALARLWARGLPGGVGWADVLHEAIARALDGRRRWPPNRSEEHTSELQSLAYLVCRLLLEKKKNTKKKVKTGTKHENKQT